MDWATLLLRGVPIALSVINTVQALNGNAASNDVLASTIKSIVPPDLYGPLQTYASGIFNTVKPALQVVAAVQTAIDPNRNKTIQGLLNVANDKMGLGLAPLTVDGDYGPKTKAMALAVQRKLGGNVVADGWVGQFSLAALQMYMQQKVAA